MEADDTGEIPPLPWLGYPPPNETLAPPGVPAATGEPVARRWRGWWGAAVAVGVLLAFGGFAVAVVTSRGPAPAPAGAASPTRAAAPDLGSPLASPVPSAADASPASPA